MQFGDWLDPDAPSDRPWEAKADSTFLANAFFSRSARLTGEAADLFGDPRIWSSYRLLADDMADATWARWQDHIIETQTGCAVALSFGIVPEVERRRIEDALADLVDNPREGSPPVSSEHLWFYTRSRWRPFRRGLSDAASTSASVMAVPDRDGRDDGLGAMGCDTARRLDPPRRDGAPPGMDDEEGAGGHMLSFNHYAYGAVVDWIYRHLAGIAPDRARPGYRHVVFAPRPPAGIEWARASIDGPLGTTSIEWQIGRVAISQPTSSCPSALRELHRPCDRGSEVVSDGVTADQR